MFHSSFARWLAALTTLVAINAVAQTAPAPSRPPPAETPELSFQSAFDGYRSYKDEKAIPWKEANETVYQRGGWRAYAKEAAESSPSEAGAQKSGADPHAGHSMPMPAKKDQP